MASLICAGEFDQPNSDDATVSALQVNFYSNTSSITLRKNIKNGTFETLDKTGAVKNTYATFALALAACKTDALATKGLTVTDAACNHSGAAGSKTYCPTYIKSLEPVVI